jgi:hypothetical protein
MLKAYIEIVTPHKTLQKSSYFGEAEDMEYSNLDKEENYYYEHHKILN